MFPLSTIAYIFSRMQKRMASLGAGGSGPGGLDMQQMMQQMGGGDIQSLMKKMMGGK
jgi:hypothetical protein